MRVLNNPSVLCFLLLMGFAGGAQELEPRAINNLPVGTNFIVSGYAFARGDILLDPSLPVEGVDAKINTAVIGYVRSINFFGFSAKIDALVPILSGSWGGDVVGEQKSVSLNGLGDLRFRFSFNFLHSPAMRPADYINYKPKTIAGLSIQVTAPTGVYSSEKLINLGSNRWVVKPQFGFSRIYDKWIIETYGSVWLYSVNNNFLGNKLEQLPLVTAKVHVIRKLENNMWLSANLGYGIGGKIYVNDVARDSQISSARFGLDFSMPFNLKHTLRLGVVSGFRFERGNDFDAFTVSYVYRWNEAVKKYLKNRED